MKTVTARIMGISIFMFSLWGGFWATSSWTPEVYEWYKLPTVITFFLVGMWGTWLFADSYGHPKN